MIGNLLESFNKYTTFHRSFPGRLPSAVILNQNPSNRLLNERFSRRRPRSAMDKEPWKCIPKIKVPKAPPPVIYSLCHFFFLWLEYFSIPRKSHISKNSNQLHIRFNWIVFICCLFFFFSNHINVSAKNELANVVKNHFFFGLPVFFFFYARTDSNAWPNSTLF